MLRFLFPYNTVWFILKTLFFVTVFLLKSVFPWINLWQTSMNPRIPRYHIKPLIWTKLLSTINTKRIITIYKLIIEYYKIIIKKYLFIQVTKTHNKVKRLVRLGIKFLIYLTCLNIWLIVILIKQPNKRKWVIKVDVDNRVVK